MSRKRELGIERSGASGGGGFMRSPVGIGFAIAAGALAAFGFANTSTEALFAIALLVGAAQQSLP